MSDQPATNFYIDILTRKHESYPYEESEIVEVEHQGTKLFLHIPKYRLPVNFRVTAMQGDILFLLGKEQDFEEEGRLYKGGDGTLVVALRLDGRADTFWSIAWHNLFDWTIDQIEETLG